MAEFRERVIALSRAAWSLRDHAPRRSRLPFALALFSDPQRLPDPRNLAQALPAYGPPIAFVFRHDALPKRERLALADEVRRVVQARGHLFLMARSRLPGVDGAHNLRAPSGLRTRAVHSLRELAAAEHDHADAVFVSPVFPTRSHPGADALGPSRASWIAEKASMPCLALGGLDERSARRLKGSSFQGFAAIGAFAERPS